MLIENTLDGERNKVEIAIKRIKTFEPSEGYWLAFSGGKDSVVLYRLAEMSGVKFDAHYSLTTVDPPELVRFIREKYPGVKFERPKESMWELIVRKGMPPLRVQRYCCEELKECNGEGRITMTGVRWAESQKRRKTRHLVDMGKTVHNDDNDEARRQVEQCYRTRKTLVNPIIDWEDEDVWEFIRLYDVPYCSLYDEGWKRLGCIGCPMAQREEEFDRWPKYKNLYIHAFQRMIDKRNRDGLETRQFTNGQECFDWWTNKNKKEEDPNQIEFEWEEA